MPFKYLKDLRAIAILSTSFGFDLIELQIVFAKELAEVFLGAPCGATHRGTPDTSPAGTAADRAAQPTAASSFEQPATAGAASSSRTGEASSEQAAIRLLGKPVREFGQPRRRSAAFPLSTSDRSLKSIAAAPHCEEGPDAMHDERTIAPVAMRDPLSACADAQPSLHDRVEKRAYELWEAEGHPDGRHLQHWLQAEREVRERTAAGRALHAAA